LIGGERSLRVWAWGGKAEGVEEGDGDCKQGARVGALFQAKLLLQSPPSDLLPPTLARLFMLEVTWMDRR
jgi:hypothetical protein